MAVIVRIVVGVVGGILLVGVFLGVAMLIGMRHKSPVVVNAVRRMNKAVLNPRELRTGGSPGASASVVHHIGRRSGRSYRTPVVAFRTGDGFAIALPYSTKADWVQNVLAAGGARIDHEGESFPVDQPSVVPMTGEEDYMSVSDHRSHRLFGVDEKLILHMVPSI